LKYSKKDEYEGLLGAFFKKERTIYFSYSKILATAEIVFFIKHDSKITKLTLLKPIITLMNLIRKNVIYICLKQEWI